MSYSVQMRNGQTVVELHGRVLRKPGSDYCGFVHVLDSACGIAFYADNALRNSAGRPAGAWVAGDCVVDRYFVSLLPGRQTTLAQPFDDWKNQSVLIRCCPALRGRGDS